MKTPIRNPFFRPLQAASAFANFRWFGSLVIGTTLLGTSASYAVQNLWTGEVSNDWNTADNWSLDRVPTNANGATEGDTFDDAVVNILTNHPVIVADLTAVPRDIIVGTGVDGNGRVDHTSGSADTSGWVYVGNNGGTGVYNLADPAGTGGEFTEMGQSSGNLRSNGELHVGSLGAGGSIGTLNINTTGTVTVPGALQVGREAGSVGVLNLDSGAITTGNWTEFGNFGGNGTLNMSGGTFTKAGDQHFIIAANGGTGVANVTGGDIIVNNEIWVGQSADSNGTLNFSGGTITNSSWVAIGRENGTGTVNMSGGTWIKDGGGNFIVGASGPGTMVQTGGLVDVQTGITWIGEQNNATVNFTLSGTGEFRTTEFVVARDAGTTATVNLDGGTMVAGRITGGAGADTVNFNGTQLVATGPEGNYINGLDVADIGSGGLLLDTAGATVTIPQILTGTGGITKSGEGTLVLTGQNEYTGDNVVTGGTLTVSTFTFESGGYTVGDGATFSVVQDFADEVLEIPDLTLEDGAIFHVDLGDFFGNTTVAPLNVAGTLTVNGPVTVNVADALPEVGTIPLISYDSKTGSGSFVLGELPPGVVATLADDGSVVSLNVTRVSLPVWNGTESNVWDTTTLNWIDKASGEAIAYGDPDPVEFNDEATGPTDIELNMTVNPATVTFNNFINPYSLTGTGKISGSTGLTKMEEEALVITELLNDYTGVTRLEGGTTSVDILANGGVASSIGAATADPANLVFAGGTLNYTGPATTIDRGFTVAGANSGLGIENDLTLTGTITSIGGGGLDKFGPGTLTLALDEAGVIGGGDNSSRIQDGTLVIDDSDITYNSHALFSESAGSDTTLIISGDSSFTATNRFQTALAADSVSEVVIQDSGSLTVTGGWFSIGNGGNGVGTATVNDSGTITSTVDFNIADVDQSVGTLNVNDSAVITSNGILFVGKGGETTGILNLNSGTVNVNNWLPIGRFDGADGTVNVTGGILNHTAQSIWVGEEGNGVLNISGTGSVVSTGGPLRITQTETEDRAANGTGVVNLGNGTPGGMLTVNQVIEGDGAAVAGQSTFNFNGGTLVAGAGANENFMFGLDSAVVQTGGAFIDTNGATITIAQPLTGTGNLTKLGEGTLTLTGENTYTGNTSVAAGTLSITSPYLANGSTVSIGSGAVLNLETGVADEIAGLIINGIPVEPGVYDATTNPGIITGTGQLNVTGSVESGYATWASANGLTAGTNDGATQDPDQDGIANLLEYVLGGNPLAADPDILPAAEVTATDFVFTFSRTDGAEADTTQVFEWSTDLVNWNAVPVGATSSAADADGVIVTVNEGDPASADDNITVTVPRANAESGKLFGRLRASIP